MVTENKILHLCFPGGAGGEKSACQCRACKRCGFDPLGEEESLEEEMATHSTILARKIPWAEEPGGYSP